MALTLVKLGGYLLSSPTEVHAQTSPQLLHQSDFTYVGAFKVPVGQVGPQANGFFDYSNGQGSGRVYNDPVNGKSLFLSGYLSTGYVSNAVSVAQVKIPTLQDPNVVGLSGLNTATVVQGFADPSNGKGTQALAGNGSLALIDYGGKLIGTMNTAYDANCAQTKSAWVGPINFSQSSQAIGPYSFTSPVGPRHDLPDMPMDEVVEFTLPDDTAAVRFVSHDPVLGDVGETWFGRSGHIFQLSVSAPDRELQDAWVRDLAANLTFPDDGAADASTQQQ